MVFELGEAVRVHMDLHAAAGPVLAHLREETGESAQVGMLDGHEVVYVDRLESSHSLRLFTETGRRVPVHCTSSGKVLLAFAARAGPRALPRHRVPRRATPRRRSPTPTSAPGLAPCAPAGWADAVDEREIGVASLAAPIRDRHGDVVAAIGHRGARRAGSAPCRRKRLARVVVEAGEARVPASWAWSPEATVPTARRRKES